MEINIHNFIANILPIEPLGSFAACLGERISLVRVAQKLNNLSA
jgi:hypothetical protein